MTLKAFQEFPMEIQGGSRGFQGRSNGSQGRFRSYHGTPSVLQRTSESFKGVVERLKDLFGSLRTFQRVPGGLTCNRRLRGMFKRFRGFQGRYKGLKRPATAGHMGIQEGSRASQRHSKGEVFERVSVAFQGISEVFWEVSEAY